MSRELLERARAFLEDDVDPATRSELSALLDRAASGEAAALADLEDRFRGPLEFGTAGLRGVIGAGESRMNRAVVIRATAGLVAEVLASVPDARARGVVIGRDGRRLSAEMQRDAAEVIAAAGVPVHFLPGTTPTPLTAFAVRHLGAAAGIVITASHNPPEYNGYKVYWDNGAQIIPPVDAAIAARIAAAPGARPVPRRARGEARSAGGRRERAVSGGASREAGAGRSVARAAPVGSLTIAYSALHGVGEHLFRAAMVQRGFTRLASVAAQAEPDGTFPTVTFPNPEEPGALDLVLELARDVEADLVLVNDPDADRLGVAVWCPRSQRHVVLDGNEIGVLLASHVLARDVAGGAERLVLATLVSSRLLGRMARDLGVRYAETLTGFKWIANEGMRLEAEGARVVFGYEEALGYTVGTVVRDKDGIGAALVMAELAASAKAGGRTLLDELERLRRAHGFFVGRQKSVTLPGREGLSRIASAMARLREAPPSTLGGTEVSSIWDLLLGTRRRLGGAAEPDTRWRGDVLVFELADGGRVAVRPSGTEPKLKLYLEVVESLEPDEAPEVARVRGDARLGALLGEVMRAAGLD